MRKCLKSIKEIIYSRNTDGEIYKEVESGNAISVIKGIILKGNRWIVFAKVNECDTRLLIVMENIFTPAVSLITNLFQLCSTCLTCLAYAKTLRRVDGEWSRNRTTTVLFTLWSQFYQSTRTSTTSGWAAFGYLWSLPPGKFSLDKVYSKFENIIFRSSHLDKFTRIIFVIESLLGPQTLRFCLIIG